MAGVLDWFRRRRVGSGQSDTIAELEHLLPPSPLWRCLLTIIEHGLRDAADGRPLVIDREWVLRAAGVDSASPDASALSAGFEALLRNRRWVGKPARSTTHVFLVGRSAAAEPPQAGVNAVPHLQDRRARTVRLWAVDEQLYLESAESSAEDLR